MGFRQFLENQNSGLVLFTSKGSVYLFRGYQTQRFKSPHDFHAVADQGLKDVSNKTVFISPETSQEIGMWQGLSNQKKRIILMNGSLLLVSMNEAAGRHGIDKLANPAVYSVSPRVGLCPLELFSPDRNQWSWLKPGMEVYSGNHPGNAIVEIKSADDPSVAGELIKFGVNK